MQPGARISRKHKFSGGDLFIVLDVATSKAHYAVFAKMLELCLVSLGALNINVDFLNFRATAKSIMYRLTGLIKPLKLRI